MKRASTIEYKPAKYDHHSGNRRKGHAAIWRTELSRSAVLTRSPVLLCVLAVVDLGMASCDAHPVLRSEMGSGDVWDGNGLRFLSSIALLLRVVVLIAAVAASVLLLVRRCRRVTAEPCLDGKPTPLVVSMLVMLSLMLVRYPPPLPDEGVLRTSAAALGSHLVSAAVPDLRPTPLWWSG
jgi:hypothetical protein